MLQEAARRLERSVDRAEMLARLGGDEYAIIFEPTTISACQLRRRIGVLLAAPIVVSDTLTIGCTASVGIADTPHQRAATPTTSSPLPTAPCTTTNAIGNWADQIGVDAWER